MDPTVIVLILVAALGGVLLIVARRGGEEEEPGQERPGLTEADEASLPPHLSMIYSLAVESAGFYDLSARPEDLVPFAPFQRAVALLVAEPFTPRDRLDLMFGPSGFLTCVAIEALARTDDPASPLLRQRLLERINEAHVWYRYFALRALAIREARDGPDESLFATLFDLMDDSWTSVGASRVLETFIEDRLRGPLAEASRAELEEAWPPESDAVAVRLHRRIEELDPELAGRLEKPDDSTPAVPAHVLEAAPPPPPEPPAGDVLGEVGRFVPVSQEPDWEEHDALRRTVDQLDELLQEPSPPSILLVGDPGVGRTTVVRALAARIAGRNWKVFESSAASVAAGQKYVGQIEQRVRDLVRALARKNRRVWFLPQFHEAIWAGRASNIPRALLHLVMPYVERGELLIVAETNPAGHQRLLQTYPQLRVLMHTVEIPALDDAETRSLARSWGVRKRLAAGRDLFEAVSLPELQNTSSDFSIGRARTPRSARPRRSPARTSWPRSPSRPGFRVASWTSRPIWISRSSEASSNRRSWGSRTPSTASWNGSR
jgi:ATP-dependent Clp protease ATP-binding subunit ClpC